MSPSAGSFLTALLSLRGYVVNNGPLNGLRQQIRKLHTPTLTCWALGIMNGDILGIHARPAASQEQALMASCAGRKLSFRSVVSRLRSVFSFRSSALGGFQEGGPCLRVWRLGGVDDGRYALYPMSLIILIILIILIEFHTWISEVGV
jgi:hypothetical protein